MMKQFVAIACLVIVMVLSVSVNAEIENNVLPNNRVDVYYMHNTFRCASCNTIENLTKVAIIGGKGINQKYKNSIMVKPAYKAFLNKKILTFRSINIDDKDNRHFLKDFNAESKFPVLVKIKDDKIVKTKMLKKAWDLMDDNQRFIDYIQQNINGFIIQL